MLLYYAVRGWRWELTAAVLAMRRLPRDWFPSRVTPSFHPKKDNPREIREAPPPGPYTSAAPRKRPQLARLSCPLPSRGAVPLRRVCPFFSRWTAPSLLYSTFKNGGSCSRGRLSSVAPSPSACTGGRWGPGQSGDFIRDTRWDISTEEELPIGTCAICCRCVRDHIYCGAAGNIPNHLPSHPPPSTPSCQPTFGTSWAEWMYWLCNVEMENTLTLAFSAELLRL